MQLRRVSTEPGTGQESGVRPRTMHRPHVRRARSDLQLRRRLSADGPQRSLPRALFDAATAATESIPESRALRISQRHQ